MEEKKKKQAAGFAGEENVFAGRTAKTGSDTKRAKKRQPGVHQPRDADNISLEPANKPGNGRQWAKPRQKKSRQKQSPKGKHFAGNKEKPGGNNNTDNKAQKVFLQEKNIFADRAGYVRDASAKKKRFKRDSLLKQMAGRAGSEFAGYTYGGDTETEEENPAAEGAYEAGRKAEDIRRFVKRYYRNKEQRRRGKEAKSGKKQLEKESNFRHQKFLEKNPQMQGKTLKSQVQKKLQKQRIKREYAKAVRAGRAAKNTKDAARKSANTATSAAKKLQEMIGKRASVVISAGMAGILLLMVMTSVSSCGAVFSGGMSTVLAGSYMSRPEEIDAADLALSELERDLQARIDRVEADYPDYDEYRYNLAPIGHDPFTLVSYLSAVHTEFTAADVRGEIESLFDGMYDLSLNPAEETRTRTVTKTGTRTVTNADGTTDTETYTYEEEEEYTVTILEVKLTAVDLRMLTSARMDAEQKEIFALYGETRGLIQQFYTPLNLYWYSYISSYYGYCIHPITGQEQFHRGVDIGVPIGTAVYAAMDGMVTTAAYDSYYGNYVVIEDDVGYCTKYAHMDALSVSAGQAVKHGDAIGTTGNTGSSTGSHLHIECLFNGEYYNPLFYFGVGEGTLYGEIPGAVQGDVIPPESYDDAAVQAIMSEAAKYVGYPYVWGGSSPSTSFDCSGFVCWVMSNSGVHDLPRTTAQGIYDQCGRISASDAKPGDIIFFTGTYNSAGPVSHVGIYCGDGIFVHAGDPIKYSRITPYWQSHFYGFGRL